MLVKNNLGTVTKLQIDNDNRFEHLFLALGPSINGFRNGCICVVAIDKTHLKSKLKGTMFVAAAFDGNDQIYLLAIGIGNIRMIFLGNRF